MLYHYKSYDPRHWVIRWLWYKLPVKKATAITVISENTRKDLIRFTGCPAGKVRVIPDFVDSSYKPAPYTFKRDNPVILFIGTAPNKNLGRLIEALSGIRARLEIIGFPDEQNKAALKAANISYSVFNVLSPEEMAGKYRNADIIAFPSTYEGFGLPILEAQATGRPVLTSAVSPMKEVAGNGACLVDPFRVEDIRNGLCRIMEDADYRDHLIREGFKNVEQYRLEKVVKQYTDLYKELLSNNTVK
jgi:glycosyltransferase involved in cell wall biosynthesis